MSLLAHKFYEFIWLILKINGIRDVKTSERVFILIN